MQIFLSLRCSNNSVPTCRLHEKDLISFGGSGLCVFQLCLLALSSCLIFFLAGSTGSQTLFAPLKGEEVVFAFCIGGFIFGKPGFQLIRSGIQNGIRGTFLLEERQIPERGIASIIHPVEPEFAVRDPEAVETPDRQGK